MRIKLDTGDIEAFTALGQSLSFKSAAESLNISPSALSRRIQKLEDQLEVRLVQRTTRSVRLTMPGKRFLARSQEILTDVDELVLAAKGQSSPRASVLTIAAIPSIAHRVLPRALQAFAVRHPTTRVRVRDLTTGDVVEAVSRGDAEFGITSFLQPESALVFSPLIRGDFVLIAPKDHVLAGRRRVRWSEVAAHRTISTWKGAGVRVALDYDLAKAGRGLDAFYEVQQIYTAIHLVEAGLGVAPIPDYFLGAEDRARLAVIALADPSLSADLGIVRSRAHPLRGLAQDFYEELRQIVQPAA